MPAALPGATLAQNLANPSQGLNINFDLLSGPKGSPFDKDQTGNATTGALCTGIGFGSPPIIGLTAPASIQAAGFSDDYIPGVTKPDGTSWTTSIGMYIGGGKSDAAGVSAPYTAGFGIGDAGQGGSRDAGAGPAFTGFLTKMVTATATTANGSAIEAGWLNRSGVSMSVGQSAFGSSTAASAAVA